MSKRIRREHSQAQTKKVIKTAATGIAASSPAVLLAFGIAKGAKAIAEKRKK